MTKGEDPSEGAEPIAAVVEDIEVRVRGCEEGKSSLMGKEGENMSTFKAKQETLNPAITLLTFHQTLNPAITLLFVSTNP